MSKMSELDAAVSEIRKCGEVLLAISEVLKELFYGEDVTDEQPAMPEQAADAEPAVEPSKALVTLEQVRGVLAAKSAAGHRADVQALIHKYGADKLSTVNPDHYAALMADAEAL